MNESELSLAEVVVGILKVYAKQTGTLPRSTSDLSPLEEWALVKLAKSAIIIMKAGLMPEEDIPGDTEELI